MHELGGRDEFRCNRYRGIGRFETTLIRRVHISNDRQVDTRTSHSKCGYWIPLAGRDTNIFRRTAIFHGNRIEANGVVSVGIAVNIRSKNGASLHTLANVYELRSSDVPFFRDPIYLRACANLSIC